MAKQADKPKLTREERVLLRGFCLNRATEFVVREHELRDMLSQFPVPPQYTQRLRKVLSQLGEVKKELEQIGEEIPISDISTQERICD